MKRMFLLVVVGLAVASNVEAKKVDGKILFENDTIAVTFNLPVNFFTQEPIYEKLQYKVRYYDKAGKKVLLKPHQAKEIQFQYKHATVRMLSRDNTTGRGNNFSGSSSLFLKLEIDGDMKLFSYYYSESTPGMFNSSSGTMASSNTSTVEKYMLQKGDGELKRPRGLTFKKDMIEYFNDCPALVERIESKDFQKNNLEFIVNFYNTKCQ